MKQFFKKKQIMIILGLLFIFTATIAFSNIYTGNAAVVSNKNLAFFKLTGERKIQNYSMNIKETTSLDLNIDKVYGFAVSSKINFQDNEAGLVRFVLSDGVNEHLVYEAYPRIYGKGIVTIENGCEETCALNAFTAKTLLIYVENAELELKAIDYIDSPAKIAKKIKSQGIITFQKENKKKQDNFKIKNLNEKKLSWQAGITSVSEMTYAEKKQLINTMTNGTLPNLQGFEYYKGGVFELISEEQPNLLASAKEILAPTASNLPSSWDWRNRHGKNWMTSVKNQGSCGSCWAFAATGATEHLVNLYYNQKLDLDLAEQEALSCSGAGSCSGGYPSITLDYYKNYGVVNEECFPYKASDLSCSLKCTNPTEKITIGGKTNFYPSMGEDALKTMIAEGAVSGGVLSWSHALTMSGWKTDTDGATIWIFKNSWGTGWGDAGYAYMKIPITDIGWTHSLTIPATSAYNDYSILCEDNDNDGYCNWGISDNKPATCPNYCSELKDCDDSNPNLGYFLSNYECAILDGCSDSDGGINYSVYGEINGETSGFVKDECIDDKTLREVYCSAENVGTYTTYTCEGTNICLDGICQERAPLPTINITNPLNGTIIVDKFLTISASANNAVRVDFYINNNLTSSDSAYPYSYKMNTKPHSGSTIIKAVAVNEYEESTSDSVTVIIGKEADPEPKLPACNDGIDNDHDGTCDFGGCAKNKARWYPADPDCTSAEDDTE